MKACPPTLWSNRRPPVDRTLVALSIATSPQILTEFWTKDLLGPTAIRKSTLSNSVYPLFIL